MTPDAPNANPSWATLVRFDLPAAAGGRLRTRDFRARTNIVLLVLPNTGRDSEAAMRSVAAHASEFSERHAQALAIVSAPLEAVEQLWRRLAPTVPLGADTSGTTTCRVAPESFTGVPVLVLTDRYGEVRRRAPGWDAVSLAGLADALELLTYIDYQCTV